jgi:hypothetical protein
VHDQLAQAQRAQESSGGAIPSGCAGKDGVISEVLELHRKLLALMDTREAELVKDTLRLKDDISLLEAAKVYSEEAASKKESMLEARIDSLTIETQRLQNEVSLLMTRLANLDHNSIGEQVPVANGAEWQFESAPGEWTGCPAYRSAELSMCCEEYSKGGAAHRRMKSGVGTYDFDFQQMLQTNVRSNKSRSIRCSFDTPKCWTICVKV